MNSFEKERRGRCLHRPETDGVDNFKETGRLSDQGSRGDVGIAPYEFLQDLIALIMMDYCFKHISHAVTELMDETLPEEQQMKILKVLNHHNGEYSRFESVRSRCNGTAVAIDLVVAFGEDTTFGQIEGFRSAVQRELEGEIPNCQVSVVLE